MVSRNPFRVRASEYLEEETSFLSLFGLNSLDIFNDREIWSKIQILRSARGGGKTSILRIFAPTSLNEIYESHYDDNIKNLYEKLKELDVYSDEGEIKVLGVNLSLFGNYRVLHQLGFDFQKELKLFYALICSRIILATLRSLTELKKLEFPKNLNEFEFAKPLEPNLPNSIPLPCSGKELFDWASDIEQKISNILEEDSNKEFGLGGFESLSILHVIRAKNIQFHGKPIAERTLLMLDDVDKLTFEQRSSLTDTLVNLRIPIGIWLAERLEALRPEELLSQSGTQGREYDVPITLERFWRENYKKFEELLSDISDKRASWHKKYNISSFERQLEDFLDDKWNPNFKTAIDTESKRLSSKYGKETKYRMWFDKCENSEDELDVKAEGWRTLEILIERDMTKKQKTLFENETPSYDEFKVSNKEKEVAEYYVRTKYDIPYYYGFSKLVKLASSNIQQFLDLSSDLFDEMISSKSFELTTRISPSRQEEILSKAASRRWDEIAISIPNSKYVIPFLNSIARFCFAETNIPTASYGAVTGIAISRHDLEVLKNSQVLGSNPRYKILSEVLSTCFAHNILEPFADSKQGQKGTTHLVMYLNRLLCFWYNLPLNYGGWREQTLETMCSFYENKFKPKRQITLDFSKQRLLESRNM